MKLLRLIFHIFCVNYLSSADPNLFGSAGRKEKHNVAQIFKNLAGETQGEIDLLKTQNPFETAAAKEAMSRTSRSAKQMQTRLLNTMGSNASPEAVVASQGAANEITGAAAGQIAVGAEANKKNEIQNLKGLKNSQMGMFGQIATSAADDYGKEWDRLTQGLETLGGIMSGGSDAATALMAGGA